MDSVAATVERLLSSEYTYIVWDGGPRILRASDRDSFWRYVPIDTAAGRSLVAEALDDGWVL